MNVPNKLRSVAERAVGALLHPKDIAERRRSLLAFFLPFFLLLIAYFAMGLYPFGSRSPLSYDLNYQYSHFFVGLKHIISGGGSLSYSWSRTLGGEFLGMIAYYLLSPFTLIILILPTSCIETSILLVILAKTGAIGSTMYAYLRRGQKLNGSTSLMFSLTYALSSYSVVYGSNLMWLDCLMALPLLVWGTERLIDEKRYGLYVFSLTYALVCNYYIGFMLCIFTAIYFFAYLFGRHASLKNDISGNYRVIAPILRICAFTAISLALSSAVLLPAYRSLSFGKTDFSVPDFTPEQTADFLELLKKYLFGSYDTVDNDGLPFVYCGMLTLLFAPTYFLNKSFGIREKLANGLVLLLMFASTALTALDIVWHGFQFPNCLNYRYSFIISFILCTLAARSFNDRPRLSGRAVTSCCIALVLMILCIQAQHYEPANDFTCIWLSIGILLVYLAVIHALDRPKLTPYAPTVLAVLLCVETFSSSAVSLKAYREDVGFAVHGRLQDTVAEYIDTVNSVYSADGGLYRIEKLNKRSVNETFSLDLRGISGSTSTLNADVIELMDLVGYGGNSNFVNYFSTSPVADAIFGIKYILTDEKLENGALTLNTDLSEKDENGVKVYYHPYALPIAYTANGAVNSLDMEKYSTPFEAVNALVSALVGESISPYRPLTVKGVKHGEVYQANVSEHLCYLPNDPEYTGTKYVEYTLNMTEKTVLYTCFPTDLDSKVDLYVNGEKLATLDSEDGSNILLAGSFENETVTVRIQWDEGIFGVRNGVSFFYTLDTEALAELYGTLAPGGVNVREHTDTKISGSFTKTADAPTLFTTVPYDEDWSVSIDGKRVNTTKTLDALLAVDLNAEGISDGEHTVIFSYSSSALRTGVAISAVGAFSLAAVMIWDRTDLMQKLRTRKKNRAT